MLNQFYVYIYLNPLKPGKFTYGDFMSFSYEPFYVGKGKKDRIYKHLKETREINTLKHNILNKIKKQNNEPIIFKLDGDLLEEAAFDLEKFYIKTIGRRDLKLGPLANMTDGGEGSAGAVQTEDHKKKISIAMKGKERSLKYRKNISLGAKNRPLVSEETKRKMSENHKGMSNKHHSEETKRKMSEASKYKNGKPIIFRNKEYSCISEARDKLNLSGWYIRKECEYVGVGK